MLTKQDLLPLIKKHKMFACEVDNRHIELINDVLAVGFCCGIERAKRCVEWRINGELWAKFIDEDITSADIDKAEQNATC
jgi:hypothetical protein